MNILSLIFAIAAAIIFGAASRGLQWGTLGLGLLCLTIAWILQLLWVTEPITF